MTAPPSPPANRHRLPSWLDLRLVLGVLLVLVSVLVGARVVAAANNSVRVWALKHDLAAGAELKDGDLRSVRVRLFDNAEKYIAASRSPVGQTISRDLGAGELLPRGALLPEPCGSLVSIPVSSQHLPDGVVKGKRIDVFATPKGAQANRTDQVLRGVTVQSATRPKGGLIGAGAQWAITVRVPSSQVGDVVKAIRTAEIDVAIVEGGAQPPADACEEPAANAEPSPSPTGKPEKSGGGIEEAPAAPTETASPR
jgi:hypothetical protein